MPPPTFLDAAPAHAVVRRLEKQLLEIVRYEAPSASQQRELLTWARDHLLSAYVAAQMVRYPDPAAGPAPKPSPPPCRSTVDLIGEMLQGGLPLEPDLTFRCPPTGCPRALALSRELPAWLRRRLELGAQRTRLHPEAELTALWQDVEVQLVTGALAYYGLARWVDADVPATRTLTASVRRCLDAARGRRRVAWTPAGVQFGPLSAPPGPAGRKGSSA